VALTAQSIIQRVVLTLQDPTSVRWPVPELCRYFNDGQREIVLQRPDAASETATIVLVNGTKQTLPASGAKLLTVFANTSGTKRAVRLVDRTILDVQTPGWHALTGVAEILHYMYDERDPTVFYVYPPATTSASLEVSMATFPTDITVPADGTLYTAVTGNMGLPDIYGNALQDYILYRAYSKDAEYTANASRVAAHYGMFANALGIEIKATVAVSPRSSPAESGTRSTVGAQ
jgi:hypothetical protein